MSAFSGLWKLLGAGDPVVPAKHRADVAACAILQELSLSDGNVAPVESVAIHACMRDLFGMSEAQIEEILGRAAVARETQRDLSEHARAVAKEWSLEDKHHVIEAIRRVIWADGSLSGHEQRLASSVVSLLGVSAADAARVLVRPG